MQCIRETFTLAALCFVHTSPFEWKRLHDSAPGKVWGHVEVPQWNGGTHGLVKDCTDNYEGAARSVKRVLVHESFHVVLGTGFHSSNTESCTPCPIREKLPWSDCICIVAVPLQWYWCTAKYERSIRIAVCLERWILGTLQDLCSSKKERDPFMDISAFKSDIFFYIALALATSVLNSNSCGENLQVKVAHASSKSFVKTLSTAGFLDIAEDSCIETWKDRALCTSVENVCRAVQWDIKATAVPYRARKII